MPATKEKTKKKPVTARLLLILIISAVTVAGLWLYASRDSLDDNALRRIMSYINLGLSGGRAETVYFTGAPEYATLSGGSVATLSAGQVCVYNNDGSFGYGETITMANPGIITSRDTVVVFDRGGSDLFVIKNNAKVFQKTFGETIVGVTGNYNGWFCVITQGGGYKSNITVFNRSSEEVYKIGLSSVYALDCAIAPDSKKLAVLASGQKDGDFFSYVSVYQLDETEPKRALTLDGDLGYRIKYNTNNSLTVLTDTGLTITDGAGEKLGGYRLDGRYLRNYSLDSDEFSAVLVSSHRLGNQFTLAAAGTANGAVTELQLNDEILDISAAGHYIAVLCPGRLVIYTDKLEHYAECATAIDARSALMRSDGTAYIVSPDKAELFIP